MPKQIYSWNRVKAGDIISFRYESKGGNRLTTILVLNQKLLVSRIDETQTFHLVGLKLETQGVRPVLRDKQVLVNLLESIGVIEVVDFDNEIYKLSIANTNSRGVKRNVYDKLKRRLKKYNLYRTYDYEKAIKSQVFLEPIVLPKNIREGLVEN
tara:strand:- start:55 stop:516 length:462 start_codon:yes stop_codon:yes gene_type:complete